LRTLRSLTASVHAHSQPFPPTNSTARKGLEDIPASFPEEKVETFGGNVALKRAGQPTEIAHSYVFLASEGASYMTGQVLHPNGGTIVGG